MIKNLRFTLLAVLMLICSKMTAQEVTLDFTDNSGWNLPTKSANAQGTFTNNGYTITIKGGGIKGHYAYYKSKSLVLLSQSGTTLTLPAFDFPVAKVEFVNNLKTVSVKANVFAGDVPVSEETTRFVTNDSVTYYNSFEIDDNYQVAKTALTLQLLDDHPFIFQKINIYKADANTKKSAGLQFSTNTYNYCIGDEFKAPTFTKKTTAKVTFTSDNEEVATVDANGVISVGKTAGTANITATAEANDEYKAGTATCTINVAEKLTFKKTTSIESGKKYLIVGQRDNATYYGHLIETDNMEEGVMKSEKTDGYTDELKVDPNYDGVYTIEAIEGGYSIKDSQGRFLRLESESSKFIAETRKYSYAFTIEPQSDGTFKISMGGRFVVLGYMERYPETFAAVTNLHDYCKMPMLYVLSDDSSTGISNVTVNKKAASNAIYNLAGQRVGKDYKGIVIINGKKMVQK